MGFSEHLIKLTVKRRQQYLSKFTLKILTNFLSENSHQKLGRQYQRKFYFRSFDAWTISLSSNLNLTHTCLPLETHRKLIFEALFHLFYN